MEANEPHSLTLPAMGVETLSCPAIRIKIGNNGIIVASLNSSFMKRTFLLFGLVAFTSASAQQKNVFDINRHIQEVLKNNNTGSTRVKIFETDKIFLNKFTQSLPKLSHILPNGDKVYLLHGDNMPCVVPDMRQFTTMPNISNPDEYFESLQFRQHLPGNIPNGVRPYRLITSK
ncbi:MAG TPA: hypothetical protein VIV35_04020 [Chitinophagaceae bacterium]